jgi:hypothetical protein
MELALNLFWVVLSLLALRHWVVRAREAGQRRSDLLRGVVVLSCILLLLFPIISVTDDLHASSELAEDWTTFARKSKAWASQFDELASIQHVNHVALACVVALTAPTLARIGWVEISDEAAPQYAALSVRSGRAPPTALL